MTATKKGTIPKILLVGTGRFGTNHLRILKELHDEGHIVFKGVIVRDEKKAKAIRKDFNVEIFSKITPSLLKSVDAIDIVTPPETHFEIVKKCLPYTNVFVEKPLTTKTKESEELEVLAKKYNRILSVGHIFRYHSVSEKLKLLLGKKPRPIHIKGHFINPKNADQGREPSFEFLHLFDVVDYIWPTIPEIVHARPDGKISHVYVRYEKKSDAHFILGCEGDERKRTLIFRYKNHLIEADFIKNTILEKKGTATTTHECTNHTDLIKKELIDFFGSLHTKKPTRANAATGKRIVSIAEKGVQKKYTKPTVAIIGGGIFGTNIALELAKFCSVTIFEKNEKLLQEGAYVNCFRHHSGYHYPRSGETVLEIQESSSSFEKMYNKAIVRSYPTYYGIARKNSNVNVDDFLKFCKKYNLQYKEASVQKNILKHDEIAMCIEVPEPGYHYETLTKIIEQKLSKKKDILIFPSTTVEKLSLNKDGSKTILYKTNKKELREQKFDFVINATYAGLNHITTSADFEHSPIRIDLAEVLIIDLPIDPISLTIIDGPFSTLISTGNPHEFTLYHVTESILDRYVPKNGLKKKIPGRLSNQEAILRESMKYFPILKYATIKESRVVHRAVRANREHDDNRVSDIIEHGFGCWSILSGKILVGVSVAQKIAETIKKQTH